MFLKKNESLQSKRLSYRLINQSDFQPLRVILADSSVTEPAGYLPFKTEEEFSSFFAGLQRNNCGIAVILENTTIGYFRVFEENMDDDERFAGKKCAGVGFVLGKAYHGKGYGTEMLTFLTPYIKTEFDCCFADAFMDNAASNRVIIKSGYHYLEDYTMFFKHLNKEITSHSYVI